LICPESLKGPDETTRDPIRGASTGEEAGSQDPPWQVKSGVHRHFSGAKPLDFPAQDGPFPVQWRSEQRGIPTLARKFRSKAAHDIHFHFAAF
jgi:hypothetical protein